jgi:two-component system, response regulator / RNA-binding antiterminator
MTRRLRQNFSGLHAVVLQVPDRNRGVVVETLGKLGLNVIAADPSDAEDCESLLASADVVFVDADIPDVPGLQVGAELTRVPLVVIIGLETPSRLQRAFELGPSAVLYKPIRSSGIYSALFFAMNEHRRRSNALERLRGMEARRGARRFVHKALLQLMQEQGIDDEQAYSIMRKESMRQRLTVEELAVRMLATAYPKRTARKA